MNTQARIASILNTSPLDSSVTGFTTFHLSDLNLKPLIAFQLPTNLRLGHLVEEVVSKLFQFSTNYKLIDRNIQIIQEKRTIGELDFIIENRTTRELTHIELAYKFYLYDPTISTEYINNWIGPNRNDSLIEKLKKIKTKQFPLLYHESSISKLKSIKTEHISQELCLLASLYIPFNFKGYIPPIYSNHIKGYYLNLNHFLSQDKTEKTYYLPSKKEWGIDPKVNTNWLDLKSISQKIDACINEKQAPLCWQKFKDTYSSFFIIWW